MFLWQGPYVWLTMKVHRHRPPQIISWCCCLLPGVSLVPPGKRQTPWLQTPGPDSCSLCLPTPIPLPLSAWLHSLNSDDQISQEHNYSSKTVLLGNKHLFSKLMKLSSDYADNGVLQPTFRGRAIIIILPWSRQLSAYLPFACHALFTRLVLKCFFPLPLSILVESITLLNKHWRLLLPDRVIIPLQIQKTHTNKLPTPNPSLTTSPDYKLLVVWSQCVHQRRAETWRN